MIAYPTPLLAVGGARTGIAPGNLLDVQDVNGNIYLWSDRRILAPSVIMASLGAPTATAGAAATSQTGTGTATATPTSCALTINAPYPPVTGADRGTAGASWSGFTMPALPAGAIVTSIVPVITLSAVINESAVFNGLDIALPAVPGSFSGTYTGASIGTTSAAVAAWNPSIQLQYSLDGDGAPFIDTFDISSIGLQINYTLPPGGSMYEPWLLTVPELRFHRSSVTDLGSFVLQNLSGDTVSRDFEKIMRKSALEGAFFVYRSWQADAQGSWIEVHGKLTVEDVGVDKVTLAGEPAINPAQDDAPAMEYSETCQWRWRSPQCGATGSTECQYSYQTCQVPERILVVLNDYEKNFGETTANVPTQVINRRRRF